MKRGYDKIEGDKIMKEKNKNLRVVKYLPSKTYLVISPFKGGNIKTHPEL